MVRSPFLAVVLVAGLLPTAALAQRAAPPLEVGIDAVSLIPTDRRGGFALGPRIVVNFDGRNALQVTSSLQPLSHNTFFQEKTDLHLVTFKRIVHAAGRTRVFTTLGGGVERTLISVPGTTFPVPTPPSSGGQWRPAATIGAGVDVRLSRHLGMAVESSFVFTERFSGRLSGGLVVPLGAYPDRPDRVNASAPWVKLSEGDRAWVTMGDGREIAGEVVGRSASRLDLRTRAGTQSLAIDDIGAIDMTDPVRNGLVLGAKIGGFGSIAPAVLFSFLLCAFEECAADDVVAFNAAFIGMATGIGAATGLLTDSLRERRVTVYRRGTATTRLTIAPLVQKQRLGVGGSIRW